MRSAEKLIVFDFDGVICNSFYDSLYTAIHAYFAVHPKNRLPLDRPLPPDAVFKFEREHLDFCRMFFELMPLGNFAMDYYVALDIITTQRFSEITTQDDFITHKETIARGILDRYSDEFYTFRRRMQESRPEEWASLLPPFEIIPETIRSLASKHPLAIATSKDIRSVDILLRHYALAGCFPAGTILDKDYAESKRAHLVRFHERHGIPFERMYFIDDKVLHLVSVADLGVVCHLAAWGFNTPREHAVARDCGCRVLELEQLASIAD
ncbi:HAD family hydrolase [bacterium]|nr:HAD family hydrolase [bacterium]